MSGLIVGLVLRMPITEVFNTEAKFVATVYADHAWEDGTHAYPAVDTVAKITGLSSRTVQRYLRVLEALGILRANGKGPKGTTRYDIPLRENADGSIGLALLGGDSLTPPPAEPEPADSGDTVTPRLGDGGDSALGDTESGDSIVSPKQTTRPLKLKEEEGAGAKNSRNGLSPEIQKALQDLGVYMTIWEEVAGRISAGWSDDDVMAVIVWMRKTCKDKGQAAQRFVKRIREGTKAPKEFYLRTKPAPSADDTEDADLGEEFRAQADDTITDQIRAAWEAVVEQIRQDMPRNWFEQYVRPTAPVHFEDDVLQVATYSESAQQWLYSRVCSIAERALVGPLGTSISVAFVVATETEPA